MSHQRLSLSSRIFRLRVYVCVLAMMVASTVVYASVAHGEDGGDPPRNSITYLVPQFYRSLYPPAAGFYSNGGVVNNITDRLLYQDPDTLELSPWIATALPEVNEDATSYTFHLREGVSYSDGSPLTAANVVSNIDLFARGDTARGLTASEQIANYDRGEVLDEHTVRFHFTAPSPGFAQAVSSLNAGLLSDSTLKLDNNGFGVGNARNIIGSGPFYAAEEETGSKLILHARKDYDWAAPAMRHHGPARIDELRYLLAGEESVRVGGLTSGQADIARQVEAPEEKHLRDRGISIVSHSTGGVTNQLAFRFRHPLLSDIRVRRALIHGIDRESLVRTLFSESYPLATAPLVSSARGYQKQSPEAYAYDPLQAERLLDAAGWRRGPDGIRVKDGQRLELTVNEALPLPRSKETMTAVQDDLRRIGVSLSLNPGDFATQQADALDENKIQIEHTVVGRADYDVIRSQYHSATRNRLLNYHSADGSVADTELEHLLDAVATSPRTEDRERAAHAVQRYLTEQAYVLPLLEEPVVYGVQPRLKGFRTESIGRPSFYEAWVDEDTAAQGD